MEALSAEQIAQLHSLHAAIIDVEDVMNLVMDETNVDFSALRCNRQNVSPEVHAHADLLARLKKIRLAVGGLFPKDAAA